MRYIKKTKQCQDFDNYIGKNELDKYLDNYIITTSIKVHPWNKLSAKPEGREIKRKLALHLYKEQKGLCIYCQQSFAVAKHNKFLSEFSHIEHIKPKLRNNYPHDTFNQKNLSLSCNGFECNKEKEPSEFCGHKKQNEYNPDYF